MGPSEDVTPVELRERLAAERAGVAFLLLRDGEQRQRIVSLVPGQTVTIGRDERAAVAVAWDNLVSRVHARLERVGGHWVLVDDGLSRNGTQVNGERVQGRRRLVDGDVVRVGETLVRFHEPEAEVDATAAAGGEEHAPPAVTEAQRRVLVALCRPYRDGAAFATPATNQRIASELVLSLDAVKGHLRVLFAKFGLEDLPPNEKRVRLVERVLAAGVVSEKEL